MCKRKHGTPQGDGTPTAFKSMRESKHRDCTHGSSFCSKTDIKKHIVPSPYPYDKRCGCPICPLCRPGNPPKADGTGSKTTCSCGGCGYGGPKAAPCLPDPLTLAGTWFCLPPCFCWDWYDLDTMITSAGCCCPQVHRKIKQGDIIC